MGIDAVALLRPRSRELLGRCLEQAELPPGSITPLEDGAALWSTFVRFPGTGRTTELRVLLREVFGADLPALHDDPRGLFLFPDVCEPRGRSYDAVLAELEGVGVWLPTEPIPEQEVEAWRSRISTSVEHLIALSTHGTPLPPEMAELERILSEKAGRLGELAREIGAGEGGELDVSSLVGRAAEALGADAAVAPELVPGCLLVRGPVAARPDLNGVESLEDGSCVLHTTRLATEPDAFALELGAHPEWTAGHDDERGVLLFDRAHIADVLGCRSYDAAVETLAGRSRWIRPG